MSERQILFPCVKSNARIKLLFKSGKYWSDFKFIWSLKQSFPAHLKHYATQLLSRFCLQCHWIQATSESDIIKKTEKDVSVLDEEWNMSKSRDEELGERGFELLPGYVSKCANVSQKGKGQIASQQTFKFCPTAALNCMQNHKEQCMLTIHLDQIRRQQQETCRWPAKQWPNSIAYLGITMQYLNNWFYKVSQTEILKNAPG